MAKKQETASLPQVVINSKTHIGSLYSQVVGVTVTDIDITLEFVYINPRKEGEVISRITLPRASGEELAKVILDTVKMHESKKGVKK